MIPLERAFRVLRVHMYIIRVAYIQSGIIVMIDDPMEDLSILGSGNRATLASFYSGDVPCPRVWSFPSLPLPSVTLSKDTIVCTCFLFYLYCIAPQPTFVHLRTFHQHSDTRR